MFLLRKWGGKCQSRGWALPGPPPSKAGALILGPPTSPTPQHPPPRTPAPILQLTVGRDPGGVDWPIPAAAPEKWAGPKHSQPMRCSTPAAPPPQPQPVRPGRPEAAAGPGGDSRVTEIWGRGFLLRGVGAREGQALERPRVGALGPRDPSAGSPSGISGSHPWFPRPSKMGRNCLRPPEEAPEEEPRGWASGLHELPLRAGPARAWARRPSSLPACLPPAESRWGPGAPETRSSETEGTEVLRVMGAPASGPPWGPPASRRLPGTRGKLPPLPEPVGLGC